MKKVTFAIDEDLYLRAKMMLPLRGQLSTYIKAALKLLVEDPDKALSIIESDKELLATLGRTSEVV